MSDEFSPASGPEPGGLTERREALGLTQEELAKHLGIDLAAIRQWESGTEQAPGRESSGDSAAGADPETVRSTAASPAAPRQLPAAVTDFTGRASELDLLSRILDESDARGNDGPPGALVISAIGGTAGIGKTALALHWAHQVAHRFPDGQLHVNLRGFDPSRDPMPSSDAIHGFLNALGVPPDRVPRDADAQADLYRSLLDGKRMLIVLDNARDEQQVRPLLPAGPGPLVLVTSRNQLTDLGTSGQARLVTLDTLTHAEAVQMLTARLGQSRAEADPEAVSEIASLCAGLPLALSVVAARVAARPRFPLAPLAAELRDAAARLDVLDVGDPRASVQSVFSWSYEQLSPEAARLFRLLGLHPGPDLSAEAAARLSGTDQPGVGRSLEELAHGCLLTEHAPGRYTFHDLLRAYAARQADTVDGQEDRRAALGRIFDYYAQTACAAAIKVYPSREMITFAADHQPAGQAGTDPAGARDFEDAQRARTWLETEHSNLIASVDLAAESGFDRHAWLIPWFLATHLARSGYTNERIALLRTALAAATRLDDPAGQAISNRFLGNAYTDVNEWDLALDCYRASATLYERLGNRLGTMKTWQGIATITGNLGRYDEALEYLENGRRLYREIGHKAGEAEMLVSMAWCHSGLAWGNLDLEPHRKCQDLARQALVLATEADNQYVEMLALHRIAIGEHEAGDSTAALPFYLRALDAARQAGDRFHEADLLNHLGQVHLDLGDERQARESWSQSLTIFDDTPHPVADHARASLANPQVTTAPTVSVGPYSDPVPHVLDGVWCGTVRNSASSKELYAPSR